MNARNGLRCLFFGLALSCAAGGVKPAPPPVAASPPPPAVAKYARVSAGRVILAHVELIDGTGAPPLANRNVTIADGKIAAIGPGADPAPSDGTTILDLRGYAVMPGIVGMHNHLYYQVRPNLRADGTWDRPGLRLQMSFSAPRLYLANGVTTMRTAGSANPLADVNLKKDIDKGAVPGPHLDVTGPYLYELAGPEDARQTVAYWADRGVTSFKAYVDLTRDELRAAVEEAHKRGLKVLGHLCSVTYPEAAEIGIDSLEHGFAANTQLDPDKKPDTCTESAGDYTLEHMSPDGAEAKKLIATLVARHVAVTSTLPLRASRMAGPKPSGDGQPPMRPAVLEAMTPSARDAYMYDRSRPVDPKDAVMVRREMDLERAFVAAGGLLLAGPDPVGFGGVIPGFGDQREIELLVDAGFSPVEAIHIATFNGATYLGRQDRIGSLAVGKNADLVVMKGDPAARISDIENVEIVFKDGVGFDTKKLLESVRGHYGEY
jgi:imidazolonepropionase-like amidohydrolase